MLHTKEQHKSNWSDTNRYKSRAHVSYESTSNFNAYNHRGLKLYIFYLLIKQVNVVKKEEN